MLKIKWLMFFFAFVLVRVSAAEGIEVTATVDRNEVSVGDVINLTITVSAKDSVSVDEPQVSNIPGFEMINAASGFETRSSYINGRFVTEQARNFTYMLAAGQKGNQRIPEISVNVNGQTYRTKPITVAVSDARPDGSPNQAQRGRGAQRPPNPLDPMEDVEDLFQQMMQRRMGPGSPGVPGGGAGQVNPDDAFFIQAEVDKNKVFVGEQVVASFYLVTRGQIRDIDTLNYPDLKGFWKEDLEMATRLNFENVVINGIPHQRALLVSYALFPIKPGKAVVDSYRAKCTVVNPFGFGRPTVVTKLSRPIDIEVMDLPANRPAHFTGGVGNYRVSARFEPLTGAVGQPVTLRVRFDGQGNAKLVELPKLELPPSFELYDQKSRAKYMRDGNSFKEFDVLMIPRQPGIFKIPPVAVAVFDPATRKFNEISSQALDLSVTGTAAPPSSVQAEVTPGDKGPSTAQAQNQEPQLPPLATDIGSTKNHDHLLIALTSLAYLASFSFLGFYGWQQLRGRPKKVNLTLVLKRRLVNVRDLVAKKDWRRVGVEMTNTVYYVLGQLAEQGGASQEIGRLLEHTPPSLRNELAEPLQKLLSQCEALSFAPEALIHDMTEKNKMDQLVANFEKVLSRAIELSEI